jgi:predicted regulator of Ras-like GTPase activity (Roadblock/LC7/MglB family)
MQTTPILTVQTCNHLLDVLEDFLDKSEASFAMVIERGGAVLSQLGTIPGATDSSIVAALAAGSFAATKELAARIGETEFSALHQQGEHSQILMCAVDEDAVLVTIFGQQTTLGLVRFYSGRTVKQISGVLEENRANQHVLPVFSQRDVASTQKLFGE